MRKIAGFVCSWFSVSLVKYFSMSVVDFCRNGYFLRAEFNLQMQQNSD